MHYVRLVGLVTILLLVACGQPADLPSSAPASQASATSESVALQTSVANAQPVPCPTVPSYPPLEDIARITPTITPLPSPTIALESMPTGTAPGGLGSITPPNDAETMRGVVAAMPQALGDYRRSENDYSSEHSFSIQYQNPGFAPSDPQFSLSLDALDGSGDSSFPNQREMLGSGSWRRDGQVFYDYTDRQYFEPLDNQRQNCRDVRLVSLTFVIGESPWFFRAHAPTREIMESLIAAFVQAVKASPSPIPYSTPTPAPTTTPLGYPGIAIPMYPPPQDTMVPTIPTATPTTTPIP